MHIKITNKNLVNLFAASKISIKVAIDDICSECVPVNAGVPQDWQYTTVLSSTLFLLRINDMLEDSSIHCYSTVDAVYSSHASVYREKVDQWRNKLVSSVEATLVNISSWGKKNLVQFNPLNTQVCAITIKKTSFIFFFLSEHSPYNLAQYQHIGP